MSLELCVSDVWNNNPAREHVAGEDNGLTHTS